MPAVVVRMDKGWRRAPMPSQTTSYNSPSGHSWTSSPMTPLGEKPCLPPGEDDSASNLDSNAAQKMDFLKTSRSSISDGEKPTITPALLKTIFA